MKSIYSKFQLLAAVFFIFFASRLTVSRTPKDDLKLLERGNTKLFEGIISGDLALVKEGIQDGANLYEVIDPFIGEAVLKLGEAHVNFPVVPPLHMAFNYGTKEHLTIANYLITLGADLNSFQLPTASADSDPLFGRGYAPAMMYGLGFGQTPNGSHAVMIERLHKSFSSKFDMKSLYQWIDLTGNPPLTHICILLENFDCLYLSIAEFSLKVEERDAFAMTSLHIAAWNGDLQMAIMLLHNGASPVVADNFLRNPLHIATVRRNLDMMALILGQALTNKSFGKGTIDRIRGMILTKDKLGLDVIDLILQAPVFPAAIPMVEYFLKEAGIALDTFIATGSHRNYMWNALRHSAVLPSVELVSAVSITKEEFASSFHAQLRPCLIVDQLARGYGIWAHSNLHDLLLRFGDLELQVNPAQFPQSRLALSDRRVKKVLVESRLPFTTQASIPSTMHNSEYFYDFKRPELFSICGENDKEVYTVTFSAQNGGLNLHSHNATWNLLVTGKKSWYLIPPEVMRNVSLRENVDRVIGKNNAIFSVAPDKFVRDVYPLLVAHRAVIEITQHPEEVIYVPHMWAHLTYAHEDSVSISQQFCSLINTDTRVHPISWILYGGYDQHRGIGKYKDHVISDTHLISRKNERKRRTPVFEFAEST